MQDGMTNSFCGVHCYTRKVIKCCGDSEILHEIVRDTPWTSSQLSDFRLVSRTISGSISEFPHDFFCCRMTWTS